MKKTRILFWILFLGCITILGCSTITRISLKGTKNMKSSFAKATLKGRYAGKIFKSAKYFSRLGYNGSKDAIKTITKRPNKKILKINKTTFIKIPKLIIKEASQFRKYSTYECQFIKNLNLSNDIIASQTFGYEGRAGILFRNMIKLGMSDEIWHKENVYRAFYKQACLTHSQAHHVIPSSSEKCRKILQKFKIDINDGRNGIILPMDKLNFAKGSLHGKNTKEYEEYVYKQIKNCKSQKAVFDKLDEIKMGLYNGEIRILSQGKHQFIN